MKTIAPFAGSCCTESIFCCMSVVLGEIIFNKLNNSNNYIILHN